MVGSSSCGGKGERSEAYMSRGNSYSHGMGLQTIPEHCKRCRKNIDPIGSQRVLCPICKLLSESLYNRRAYCKRTGQPVPPLVYDIPQTYPWAKKNQPLNRETLKTSLVTLMRQIDENGDPKAT